ncbi:T9SS type A sorting domain-containing protein [bacterium]|nr:T9SS type A sorting domain-containing protein [bacterium]
MNAKFNINLILVLVLFALSANSAFAISYLHILNMDDEEIDTIVQGNRYAIEMDCESGTLGVIIAHDLDADGIFDPDDDILISGYLEDNRYDSMDPMGNDFDTTDGLMRLEIFYFLDDGNYIFVCCENGDSISRPLYILAPDSVLRSVSGTVSFEGITPPDTIFGLLLVFARRLDFSMAGLTEVDSMGNYSINWPVEAESLELGIFYVGLERYFADTLGYVEPEDIETLVFVDGHITDINFFVPFWIPDSGVIDGHIISSESEPITADSLFLIIKKNEIREDDSVISYWEDTFYTDCDTGYFEFFIPLDRWGGACGNIYYYKVPAGYIIPENEWGWGFWFNTEEGVTECVFNDTLFIPNDTLWLSYSFDEGTTPVIIDLPVKVSNRDFGYVETEISPESTIAVGIYDDGEEYCDYSIFLNCDSCLPENYGFRSGEARCSPGDTFDIVVAEMNAFVAGTLLTPEGERIFKDDWMQICEVPWYEHCFYKGVEIIDGVFSLPLFEYCFYKFETHFANDTIPFYMFPHTFERYIAPDTNTVNIVLYPADTTFWLYLDIDSDEPMDDSLLVTISSPNDSSYISIVFATNEWVSIPIPDDFTESCKIRIGNNEYTESPFTRLIENNGYIEVMPGDSIYLTAIMPIDNFVLELVEDPEDSWQHPMRKTDFYMNYYSIEDTHLVYRYTPNDWSSLILPIFEEQYLFGMVWQEEECAKHYFIANANDLIIIGGPYRPSHVTKYLNKGSAETLLYWTGYPPWALPAEDSIFVHASCVQVPDHPENHYYRELPFFFGYFGNVMCFHDLCDGQWTFTFPETLPGGFTPAFTETSFYVENISIYPDEWQTFPISIPVIGPPGIEGNVIINSIADPSIAYWVVYAVLYDSVADTIVAEDVVYQYYPFNSEHYKFTLTDIPSGDYILRIEYRGSDDSMFYYPDEAVIHYSGGHITAPDFYVDYLAGIARVYITGLPEELYTGSFVEVFSDIDTFFEHIGFGDLVARYAFCDSGETLEIPLPEGDWKIKPMVLYGLSSIPEDTILSSVPIDTHYVVFQYGGFSSGSAVAGTFVADTFDPSPISVDSFIVTLYGIDGETALRDTFADIYGDFAIYNLYSPAIYFLGIDYMGSGTVFIEKKFFRIDIPFSDTLELDDIYVDNGNATVIVDLHGVDREYLDSVQIKVVANDIDEIADTLVFAFDTFSISDTFILCDGSWTIFAPEIDSIEFVPSETTLIIDESAATYNIEFANPADIREIQHKPDELLLFAYPNPFNNTVMINLVLEESDNVVLEVFDIAGKKIDILAVGKFNAGEHIFHWAGKDSKGKNCSSGVYFFHARTSKKSKVIRGIYLK